MKISRKNIIIESWKYLKNHISLWLLIMCFIFMLNLIFSKIQGKLIEDITIQTVLFICAAYLFQSGINLGMLKISLNIFNKNKISFNQLFSSSKPELIIAMGDLVAKSFMGKEENFDKYRKKIHKYQDIDLIVTYHPKNLLSSPKFKRPTWEDFKYIRDKYLDGK